MNESSQVASRERSTTWICVALAIITLAVYWPIHSHGFVNYDDDDYITENVHVLNGLTWPDLKWAFSSGQTGYAHPLTWLTHQFDCQVFGLWAGGHHLTSLVIHIATSILLFLLFWRTTRALWSSAFVGLLFAIHPLHVQSVAWATELKDVLCGLFWILTLHAYVSYAAKPRAVPYLIALLMFGCGLLSKPMIVTLPFVLFLFDYWPLQRFTDKVTSLGRLILEKIPFALMAAIWSVITFVIARKYGGMASSTHIGIGPRVANALVSYAAYLEKTFWPRHLAVFYPHPGLWPWSTILVSTAVLLVVTALCLTRRKSMPFLVAGWLWYLVTLLPVIGLVQVGDQAMADRYMYVPMIGVLIMVAWGVPDLIGAMRHKRIVLGVFAFLMLAGSAAVTARQLRYWQDSVSLYQRALEVNPNNGPLVYDGLADAMMRAGRLPEADDIATYSQRQFPEHAKRLNLAGLIKFKMNQPAEAEALWKRALELDPDGYQIHNNLGILYAKQERWDEARSHFQRLTELRPDDVVALGNLAQLCFLTKDYASASRYCERALAISPNDPMLRQTKANLEKQQWNAP